MLNGASSSGKSSLLRALQEELVEPYLEAGLDKFLWTLPRRYLSAPLWNEVLGHADRAGAVGHGLVRGMHAAWAALARAGNGVLADHVLVERDWLDDCVDRLAGLPSVFVGVVCPLSVLEERERARSDRTVGQARLQHAVVHRGARYDLVIDTSRLSAEQAAKEVAAHLSNVGPSASFNSGTCRAA